MLGFSAQPLPSFITTTFTSPLQPAAPQLEVELEGLGEEEEDGCGGSISEPDQPGHAPTTGQQQQPSSSSTGKTRKEGKKRSARTIKAPCQICGGGARNAHYGVVSCNCEFAGKRGTYESRTNF